ncbi:hypothetical protein FDP41_011523 [Naegleria fowleri]|uniref:Uncharacterized protein n=1 Tax=Naegleria fowleri TaxID=5763 RepID=A0A6A5BWX9_NAEFO|nr:uncharacterized protein FDP41_011523 [Naegleria fowleri]KAF0982593.1 hypothetical protein FDP41_011523 [Naegleria fowleri]
MSGLNFVKSNSNIDAMLANNNSSPSHHKDDSAKKTMTNKDPFKNSPINLSMDIPMDEKPEKYNNNNNNNSTTSLTPPHPISSQHYYRKLFSAGNDKTSSSLENDSSQNSHQSSHHSILSPYSVQTGHPPSPMVLTPPALMYPANNYPIVMLPPQYYNTSPSNSSFPSMITDALFSLFKYIITFLISIGVFKFGKRWFKSYFSYLSKKKIFENSEPPIVSLPENNENSVLAESKEEDTVHNNQEHQPIASSKWQSTQQREPINDIGTILFLQRELNDLKLYMNELKTKISDIPSNSSFSSTLLKQIEMQHEQQKLVLSQNFSQNKHSDNLLNIMEMQREISNLRSDISQLKGMMTMTPTILSSNISPTRLYQTSQHSERDRDQQNSSVMHNPSSTAFQPKFLQQNLTSHSVIRNEAEVEQTNYREISTDSNTIERPSSPSLNISFSKSKDEPTKYVTGINKRTSINQAMEIDTNRTGIDVTNIVQEKQPSPVISSSSEKSSSEKTNQFYDNSEKTEKPETEPVLNSTNTNFDYYTEYGEKIEPISEEEYNQVYDDYLSSLGKRFENQFNFHTGVDVEQENNSAKTNNQEDKSSAAHEDTATSTTEEHQIAENTNVQQPQANKHISENEQAIYDDGTTPSAERKTVSDFDTTSPVDADVFNILKTPSLSFDELFVKAAPKTESTVNYGNNEFNSIHMYEADNIISSNNNSVNQTTLMTPSLKEATKELRKTQLTAKQKKSKIFGMLLGPEKKKKKKKDTAPKEEKQSEQEQLQTSQEIASSSTEVAAQTTPSSTGETNNIEFVTLKEQKENISSKDTSNNLEVFTRFENYPFDSDERFQRMLSLTADDDECPVDKSNPNFLTIQKGIYFKQLLGNDEFGVEAYFKHKGIDIGSSAVQNE